MDVGDLLLKARGPPDLSLAPLLVQLLLGRLLQGPDVVHRHPVVPVHPAKHLFHFHLTQTQFEAFFDSLYGSL